MVRITAFAIVCFALTGVALADEKAITEGYVYHNGDPVQGAYVVADYWNGEATGYTNESGWYVTGGSGEYQAPYQNWTKATYGQWEDEKQWGVEEVREYPAYVTFSLHLPDPKK